MQADKPPKDNVALQQKVEVEKKKTKLKKAQELVDATVKSTSTTVKKQKAAPITP